jgi:RHS repeat-associated protein
LTVAVATNAAFECGDLRLVHPLPSVRARGTVRTPTLLYNSRFAHPFGLVQATLSVLPHDITNVTARLRVPRPSGDIVVSQGFSDALFTASRVQKFTLGFDASALPTGVYPYTLTTTFSLGGTPDSLSATGELIVVNRKTSPFGAGWWLAGYERIYVQDDGSLLWVGGDGSARHYDSVATNVFKAPAIDRPDSITVESGNFVRHLRSGAKVEFAPNGKHFATSDRLGLVTFFHHDQFGQMVHIDPAGIGSLRYNFSYINDTGPLEIVIAPTVNGANRWMLYDIMSDGRVISFRDPDSTFVQFDYGNTSIPEQITTRTNKRGVHQWFEFDAVGKLTTVRVPLNASDTAVTTFCPAESRGFVSTTCSSGPLHPDSAVTVMDGPRTDVTDVTTFRLDRFGAPKLIRDGLGNQTQLLRGNRTFPALITRVVYANGWTNDAFHDAKGLPTKLVGYAPLGPGRDAVTEYTWDPKWERVTEIRFPEQNVLQFAYDTATGNRLWQQDGRGDSSRVEFSYLGSGVDGERLLASIRYQADPNGNRARDTLEYDVLGNVAVQRRAVGTSSVRVSRFVNDSIGRTVVSATDLASGGSEQRRDSIVLDVMDRGIKTIASTLGTAAAESLFTSSVYDAEGNRRRLERWSYPEVSTGAIGHMISKWGYDLADRVVADTAPDGKVERHVFDRAGNLDTVVTRRQHAISMTYDALGRLTKRRLPAVAYDSVSLGIAAQDNEPFPRRPNSGTSYVIAADSEVFAYDEAGRVTTANNRDARVTRTYFANGLLESEQLEIRNDTGSTFGHSFLTSNHYDLNGRRTSLHLPSQLVPSGTRDSITFAWDSVTSELRQVVDPLANAYSFAYTLRSEPRALIVPGDYERRWTYDPDGSLSLESLVNLGTTTGGRAPLATLQATRYSYDAAGRRLTADDSLGFREVDRFAYTGLGYLASSSMQQDTTLRLSGSTPVRWATREVVTYDGLGNMATNFTADTLYVGSTPVKNTGRLRTSTYQSGVGRLTFDGGGQGNTTFTYDSSGNVVFSMREPSGSTASPSEDRFSYYGPTERLVAADFRSRENGLADDTYRTWAFESYRYDALGRRVWTKADRDCEPPSNTLFDPKWLECDLSTLRRTVWDGDQELIEIQVPLRLAGSTQQQPDSVLENDVSLPEMPQVNSQDPNPFFGRVLFIHGLETDKPIGLVRYNYVDFFQPTTVKVRFPPTAFSLHWNAQGKLMFALCTTGTVNCVDTDSGRTAAMAVDIPRNWFAYNRPRFVRRGFQGTLLQDKEDAARTLYRRNRYYDPATGRFTQEDPIGLAGGLNLYGFASGDPVNFADPFGLCPPCYPDQPGGGFGTTGGTDAERWKGLGILAGITIGAVAAIAGPELAVAAATRLMARGGVVVAGAAAAGGAVSAKDAIARGLVQTGGNLARLLPEIEAQAARLNPQSADDALAAVARATQSTGLEVGKITPLANGTISILSRGGVTTTLGTNGSILIERGKDVLLNIPR